MIVAGMAVGAIAATSGYLFALWVDKRMEIPLRDLCRVFAQGTSTGFGR